MDICVHAENMGRSNNASLFGVYIGMGGLIAITCHTLHDGQKKLETDLEETYYAHSQLYMLFSSKRLCIIHSANSLICLLLPGVHPPRFSFCLKMGTISCGLTAHWKPAFF